MSARSIAAARTTRWRPRRRRRARGLRTTTGAPPAVVFWAAEALMIAAPGSYLAAKHPIGPRGVAEDQRHEHGHAEQHEDLAVLGRCRLPDGDALRHDIGPHADAEPGIGQRKQRQRQKEW